MNNIPKGYKLLPVEPTDEMIMAFITRQAIGFSDEYPSVRFGGNYRAMLAAAPTPPQPIYDEAKERELFESFQVDEGGNIDFEGGYYDNVFIQSAWDGWKACAQSRAKAGEVGHE